MAFPPRLKVILLATGLGVFLSGSPASGLSRDWYCFFDEGSATLSDRCKAILGAAAEYWAIHASGEAKPWQYGTGPNIPPPPNIPPTNLKIEVWGTSGDTSSPEANRQLSLRRALAVADELSSRGVPQRFVVPVGFGQDRLLVFDTPDPQNRNVRLVFR